MSILVCGDLHFREKLGYDNLVTGGRDQERQDILDFIVGQSYDCDRVVLLGDNFQFKNNPSSVIKSFVQFLERFGDKQLFILAGNHEKWGDGKSAIDFLREIKGKNWHVITNATLRFENMTFLPYMHASEVGATDVLKWQDAIMKTLEVNDSLFMHHTIAGSSMSATMDVDQMITREPVLPYKQLAERFKYVFGGHIHMPSHREINESQIVVTGSIFANEAGDLSKYVYKFDGAAGTYEQILVPGRSIYSLHNPELADINALDGHNIVKVKLTKILSDVDREKLDAALQRFDAHIVVEDIPHTRIQSYMDNSRNILELDINELLDEYAKQRSIDAVALHQAFNMIK
jgi:DNA repair exonuclease SbcCD nuclease subunit